MWSKTKRAIKQLWCESLRDRVDIHITQYRTNDAFHGRGWITVDGVQVFELKDCERCAASWVSRQGPPTPSDSIVFLSSDDLCRTIALYLSTSFEESLRSSDLLTQILVSLDRRLGKRRLTTLNWSMIHERARPFYLLRAAAEGLHVGSTSCVRADR